MSAKSGTKPQAVKDDGGAFVTPIFGAGGSSSGRVVTSGQRGRGRVGPRSVSKSQSGSNLSK